jgi:hypothetical protein
MGRFPRRPELARRLGGEVRAAARGPKTRKPISTVFNSVRQLPFRLAHQPRPWPGAAVRRGSPTATPARVSTLGWLAAKPSQGGIVEPRW